MSHYHKSFDQEAFDKRHAKREKAVLVMAKKAGGFRSREMLGTYPKLFNCQRAFDEFICQMMDRNRDLKARTTGGGIRAYFLIPNLYLKWTTIWDIHAAGKCNGLIEMMNVDIVDRSFYDEC